MFRGIVMHGYSTVPLDHSFDGVPVLLSNSSELVRFLEPQRMSVFFWVFAVWKCVIGLELPYEVDSAIWHVFFRSYSCAGQECYGFPVRSSYLKDRVVGFAFS